MKTRRQYDRTGGPEEFKKMAVELADAKGSIQTTAEELGITPHSPDGVENERLLKPSELLAEPKDDHSGLADGP